MSFLRLKIGGPSLADLLQFPEVMNKTFGKEIKQMSQSNVGSDTLDLNEKMQTRLMWQVVVTVACLFALAFSTSGFADTYNFFFPNQKKNKSKVEAPANNEVDEEQSGGDSSGNSDDEEQAPQAKAEPAPVPQVKTESVHQTQTIPNAGSVPIVINNNINTTATVPAAPVYVPVAPAPQVIYQEPPKEEKKVSVNSDTPAPVFKMKPSPWKLGLGGIMMNDWDSRSVGSRQTFGGNVSLGVEFTRNFGMNAYLGARVNNDNNYDSDEKALGVLGAEIEIQPFRSASQTWSVADIGFLAGAMIVSRPVSYTYGSSSYGSSSNYSSTSYSRTSDLEPYIGAKFTLNLNESFGLSAIARGNSKQVLFEAGLVTRL